VGHLNQIIEGARDMLTVGETAPPFTLTGDDGQEVSLAGLRGRRVALYFYPAALTSGCTIQARGFRDRAGELDAAGLTVVGVSRDDPSTLAGFRQAEQLPFVLLSDPDASVHRAYGAWGEKRRGDETVTGVIRSTFLIDPDGRVEQALYGVSPDGHVEQVLALLAEGAR
jgi:peroxiredoxin Q/BCP